MASEVITVTVVILLMLEITDYSSGMAHNEIHFILNLKLVQRYCRNKYTYINVSGKPPL
jgi:hypothetical protein